MRSRQLQPPNYGYGYNQDHDIRQNVCYDEPKIDSASIVAIALNGLDTGPPVLDVRLALKGEGKEEGEGEEDDHNAHEERVATEHGAEKQSAIHEQYAHFDHAESECQD